VTKRLFVVVVVLTLGVSPLVLAQSDPHIGTWKLNISKSKITPPPTNPPPQSVMRTYEAFEGDGIKATFVNVSADGKKTTSTYSAHFDGKDYPYTGETTLNAIALKRVDAYTWAATNKVGGKVVNTGTNTVSKDGKTLTWSYKGTNPQGQPTSGVQVFEKQ
jgi:hypothetical protein